MCEKSNINSLSACISDQMFADTWQSEDFWGIYYMHEGNVLMLPLHIIDQSCLEQQIPSGKEVVTDDVLIGSDCHSITDTKRAENIQNLQEKQVEKISF